MGTYKPEVGNKACLEGCIVEHYIQNECLTFCSRYLCMTETKFNHIDRNDVLEFEQPRHLSVFNKAGRPLEKMNFKQLAYEEWELARLYVLKNYKEVEPFLE